MATLKAMLDIASKELNITSCSGPKLNGDSVLSHASTYCVHLISVDISWTGATDNGIKALVQACRRYFDVSGCKKVTDTGVQAIAMTCHHLQYLDLSSTQIGKRGLKLLHLYGCTTIHNVKAIQDVNRKVEVHFDLSISSSYRIKE
ncbi:UNVERIFIED_CONTAM: hypothetical protein FKN15_067322 [Acipenser sinensis]